MPRYADFLGENHAAVTADAVTAPSIIYVGSTGNLTVTDAHGNPATYTAVPAGTRLPVMATSVLSAGLTAGALVRIWG